MTAPLTPEARAHAAADRALAKPPRTPSKLRRFTNDLMSAAEVPLGAIVLCAIVGSVLGAGAGALMFFARLGWALAGWLL